HDEVDRHERHLLETEEQRGRERRSLADRVDEGIGPPDHARAQPFIRTRAMLHLEVYFRRLLQENSERSTLAICQNHKLRTLSPLSFADFWNLFLRQQCAIREALVTADPLLFIKLSEKRTPEVLERAVLFPSFSHRQRADALGYR